MFTPTTILTILGAIIYLRLGQVVGGAIGVPLFLAQGISVALYILACAEGWVRMGNLCHVAYEAGRDPPFSMRGKQV